MEQVAPYQFERTNSPEAIERRQRRHALTKAVRLAELEARLQAEAQADESPLQLAYA